MSVYAYIGCKTCKEYIFLGKWLRNEAEQGFGFWHGTLCTADNYNSESLGKLALAFISNHLNHEIIAVSEGTEDEEMIDESWKDIDELILQRTEEIRAQTLKSS